MLYHNFNHTNIPVILLSIRYDAVALSPMIPTITIERNNIRQIPAGSWNRMIPKTTVPTAPIPVQTAYAVPIGSSLVAISRNRKLAIKPITVIADGISFVKFAEYFRLVAHNTSKKLAINNSTFPADISK